MALNRAAVIGAGFGGLALAIRLQSAGIATTLIEARDRPGGRAYVWEKEGHIFDAGPTVITDPDCLRALWALTGADIAGDVELVPVAPFYRLDPDLIARLYAGRSTAADKMRILSGRPPVPVTRALTALWR